MEDNTKIHIVYTTIDEDDLTKGDFIDLGLPSGLKWASCNLGATKPCEYGDYYQWGSTTPNTDTVCDWEHTPFHEGSSSTTVWTKYNTKASYGTVDNKTVLDPEDDAAYVATNGKAHIPTQAQFQELIDNTTSEWVNCTYLGPDHSDHNVMGRKFTASNGNSIFIPASGGRLGSSFFSIGSFVGLWSSSLFTDYPIGACDLDFTSDLCYVNGYDRYGGLAVRPVSKKFYCFRNKNEINDDNGRH